MSRDLRLILPAMLSYGVRCWAKAWADAAKRLLRPPGEMVERGGHTTV